MTPSVLTIFYAFLFLFYKKIENTSRGFEKALSSLTQYGSIVVYGELVDNVFQIFSFNTRFLDPA